jgi:hypothetical protein
MTHRLAPHRRVSILVIAVVIPRGQLMSRMLCSLKSGACRATVR